MSTFSECGCELEPKNDVERCLIHFAFSCHGGIFFTDGRECPPCYRSRLLSVSISATALPTRSARLATDV
jgi:hypothetical protein